MREQAATIEGGASTRRAGSKIGWGQLQTMPHAPSDKLRKNEVAEKAMEWRRANFDEVDLQRLVLHNSAKTRG